MPDEADRNTRAPLAGEASPAAAAPVPPRGAVSAGDPYCARCGYLLSGLTESAHCPECGGALVEVLIRARGPMFAQGKRYRSQATLLGWPLVEIARGPREDLGERFGKARAWIAIGDVAIGGVAIGGSAFGGVAIGGFALGGASMGGMAIGALIASGGGAIGGWAVGGGAAGGVASGGGAIGYIASGGGAVGVYAQGGGASGRYVVDATGRADPQAVAMFQRLDPLVLPGPGVRPGPASLMLPLVAPVVVTVALGALIALLAALLARRPRQRPF